MHAIELENAVKTYQIGEVKTHALDGVSLSIAEGEFTALVGPSGSGKTTMLQLMGCLDRPNSGAVKINGQDVTKLSKNKRADLRREKIGFIFQFFALIPVLTAYENVELPLLLNNVKAKERQERVMGLLEAVGLADRARHRPHQLSGGEQQRVAIARALANDPPIILADEPTGELDTRTGEGVVDLLAEINREYGKTIVVVSHDPGVAHRAERIIELMDGKTVDAFY